MWLPENGLRTKIVACPFTMRLCKFQKQHEVGGGQCSPNTANKEHSIVVGASTAALLDPSHSIDHKLLYYVGLDACLTLQRPF